jgi:hypothetical protein
MPPLRTSATPVKYVGQLGQDWSGFTFANKRNLVWHRVTDADTRGRFDEGDDFEKG